MGPDPVPKSAATTANGQRAAPQPDPHPRLAPLTVRASALDCAARRSEYAKACADCGTARTCEACEATADCSTCSSTARCGGCRSTIFKLRRARGVGSSRSASSRGGRPRPRALAPALTAVEPVAPDDRRDFPRDRDGYYEYLDLLASSGAAVARAGARWLVAPHAPGLLHEIVVAKDSYETPAWLWRHYVERESLTVDANATASNAVTPTYLTAADPPTALEGLRDVGIWLNPAYGSKCTAIEPTLARLLDTAVAERGCWLVALLPLYSLKTWCALHSPARPRPDNMT